MSIQQQGIQLEKSIEDLQWFCDMLTLILPVSFVLKKLSVFYVCCIYSSANFKLDFIMEANIVNPYQTSPMEAVLCA